MHNFRVGDCYCRLLGSAKIRLPLVAQASRRQTRTNNAPDTSSYREDAAASESTQDP
jgi:hypothetical protein